MYANFNGNLWRGNVSGALLDRGPALFPKSF